MIYILSNLFKKESIFVKTIAQNTLFIMFFHTILLFLTKVFNINTFILNIHFQSLIFLLYTLILFVFMYFSIKLLYKYCPLMLGKYNYETEENNDQYS